MRGPEHQVPVGPFAKGQAREDTWAPRRATVRVDVLRDALGDHLLDVRVALGRGREDLVPDVVPAEEGDDDAVGVAGARRPRDAREGSVASHHAYFLCGAPVLDLTSDASVRVMNLGTN